LARSRRAAKRTTSSPSPLGREHPKQYEHGHAHRDADRDSDPDTDPHPLRDAATIADLLLDDQLYVWVSSMAWPAPATVRRSPSSPFSARLPELDTTRLGREFSRYRSAIRKIQSSR
jgi:hypothetical protein